MTWNEFLPISMPITAIALLSFCDMAAAKGHPHALQLEKIWGGNQKATPVAFQQLPSDYNRALASADVPAPIGAQCSEPHSNRAEEPILASVTTGQQDQPAHRPPRLPIVGTAGALLERGSVSAMPSISLATCATSRNSKLIDKRSACRCSYERLPTKATVEVGCKIRNLFTYLLRLGALAPKRRQLRRLWSGDGRPAASQEPSLVPATCKTSRSRAGGTHTIPGS